MNQLAAMAAFVTVTEQKSLTAAAETLGTTKGSVSKAIKALEQSVGTTLLNRTTRSSSLTEAGRIYREHCLRVLEEVETAREAVHRLHAEPRGRLHMSAAVTLGQRVLTPSLPGFLSRHPLMTVDLVLTNRTIDQVEDGFDICVRIGAKAPLHLAATRLARFRWVTCAAPKYLAATGTPGHPRDLAGHRLLSSEPGLEHEVWYFRGATGQVRVPIAGCYCVNNVEALTSAAEAGAGVAVLPSYVIGPSLRRGTLQEVLQGWKPVKSAGEIIWAEFLPGRQSLPKVRAMLDFLAVLFARTLRHGDLE
jgi:DNA-binding transcriptional LysR family regulator